MHPADEPSKIRPTMEAYFDLLVADVDEQERMKRLTLVLDRLAVSSNLISMHDPEDTDWPDPPRFDYRDARKIVERAFPSFGYDNTPLSVAGNIAQTELAVGDAIDDLADILLDLQDVAWRLDNGSQADAQFHFLLGFRTHWGKHLRELQLYLHEVLHDPHHPHSIIV